MFRKIASFFSKMFYGNKIDSAAAIAVKVVNILKDIVENPITETVVKLTPTKFDDELLYKAKIILGLLVKKQFNIQDEPVALQGLTTELRVIDKENRGQYYVDYSAKILQGLDNTISYPEAVITTQTSYLNYE